MRVGYKIRLSGFTFVKPCEAKRYNLGRIFYPTLTRMEDSFFIYYVMKYRKLLIKYNAYISQP